MKDWSQDLSAGEAAQVNQGVINYGRTQAVGGHAQPISCGLHEDGQLIAGATGRTEFRRLYIGYLWVDEAWRGGGIGTEVLRRIEAQALQRGCVDALIETLSDRTADWYERLGYVCMSHVHDFVPGFHPPHPDQGLEGSLSFRRQRRDRRCDSDSGRRS